MKLKINVIDVGARYGLHPSWDSEKNNKDIKFYLFEPEPKEFLRLKKKYRFKKNVKIINSALGSREGENLILNVTKHKALSSMFAREDNNPLLTKKNTKVLKKIKVRSGTLDNFCKINRLKPDFIKLDAEGFELNILKGLRINIKNILGVRSEVSFDGVFKNSHGDFNLIHEFLTENGFKLLNLDYDGKGFYFSNFLSSSQKYGILQTTDAVWIKNPYQIEKYYSDEKKILKAALFLIDNNGIDLSIHLLKYGAKKFKQLNSYKNTTVYRSILKKLTRHFQNLKWTPGIRHPEIDKLYRKIFKLNFPKDEEYNQSEIFNP